MPTRYVTLSLPEDLLRRAKVLAAERDSSVSAIVTQLLESAVGHAESDDELWRAEEQIMREGVLRVGEITWTREELHSRGSA